ncbi:MAG: class I SAM-dependent methyltransferase [Thermodesulfobacteriota bacterium]
MLLPPENRPHYEALAEAGAQILASPARRFFSTRHFKWLRENLRSSETAALLLANSPYRDLKSFMASLVTLLEANKTIILLRIEQKDTCRKTESGIDQNNLGLAGELLSTELNFKFLAQEFARIAWSYYPEFVKNLINYIERELRTIVNTYLNRPVNFRRPDFSQEAIQRDVEKSLISSNAYLNILLDGLQTIKGKKVLEIGPGTNFGLILSLACHGAQALVADRFLAPWDPDYHPRFYALLRDRLINRWPSIDTTPLDMVLSQGGYPRESISLYPYSLEELSELPDESVDVIISNAVLEHLYDLKSAFTYLARITKPGGLDIHTVDFRDHRDFSRPLEYLLLSDKEFARGFKECHGEHGNRYRPQEMRQLFEQVGFTIKSLQPISVVEEEYLADFLERLRQAEKSRYRHYPVEDLRLMVGTFIVVKQ